jgi:hypothetical protein
MTKNWFESYNSTLNSWSETLIDSTRNFSNVFGDQGAGNVNEAFTKGVNSYMKMYDSTIKNATSVLKEGFEAGRKTLKGEDVKADEFFETLKKACDDAVACVSETLKETPFEGIKEIDEAIKKSMDSFSDEQKAAHAFLSEIFEFNTKLAKLSATAVKETGNALKEAKEGEISIDGYKSILNEYGETIKRALDKYDVPAALLPEYKANIDGAIELANKNIDLLGSWIEINLKSAKAMSESASEIYKVDENIFTGAKITSPDALIKMWRKPYDKASRDFVEKAQLNESIPKFIEIWSDYIKSTGEHYRKMMTLPAFVTEKDLDRISSELAKIKTASEKSAKTKSKAKEAKES